MNRNTHTIDASGQIVGRLATKIATILIGKHKAGWRPNVDSGDVVRVSNADKLVLTGKKIAQKRYYRYSGYPGGMKTRQVADLLKTKPAEVLRLAVRRMLPKNTHLINRMKRLQIQ